MGKITLRNGSSLKWKDGDPKDGGRGLTPFKPHPCQEMEITVYQMLKVAIDQDKIVKMPKR